MNGAGNDFILIDKVLNPKIKLTAKIISKMCKREIGIGADGVLLIDKHNKYDFNLKYYNSNGKVGSLCGNGSRCAISYAASNYKIKNSKVKFLCSGKIYSGEVLRMNLIKFHLHKPTDIKISIVIKTRNYKIKGSYVDTGSPHVVIFWDDIKKIIKSNFNKFDITKIGREIRNSKQFAPNGTNVNFVKIGKGVVKIRTYERGVEAETLACGTGAVAATVVLSQKFGSKSPIKFQTKSSKTLQVDFLLKKNEISKISLTGPAKINYIGTYNF